jgi:RNA polymerase sigma-70 factor (ECF subfamily)
MNREMALLAAAKKMDGDAISEIFELYAPALYQYAFRLSNNATLADQIVGDAFAKFVERLSAGRIPSLNLRFYLYEIAYGIFTRERLYSNFFVTTSAALHDPARQGSRKQGSEEQKVFDMIHKVLLFDLTDDQRHVIILRFMEGFSLKETAAIMGKKVNNVKVIQNRGIAALRKALQYQPGEKNTIALLLRRMGQALPGGGQRAPKDFVIRFERRVS